VGSSDQDSKLFVAKNLSCIRTEKGIGRGFEAVRTFCWQRSPFFAV